jgi:Domain of unknown function (DUF1127)
MYPTITMTAPAAWNVAWLGTALERMMKRIVDGNTRRALLRLDDRMLNDLGLTRNYVETGNLDMIEIGNR